MEHAAAGPAWAVALEATYFAQAIRDSLWIYPLANVLHVVAIAILLGAIAVFDLRLLGLARGIPVAALAALAPRLARIGVAVALPTGFILFAAEAPAYLRNPVFLLKLAAIAAALINLTLFHAGSFRAVAAWGDEIPVAARLAAAISLAAWTLAVVCGRFLAYW